MMKLSDKINVDQLAEMFDLPTQDEIIELNIEYSMEARGVAEGQALEEGESEEEAEAIGFKAEEETLNEVYRSWYSGVTGAADELFGQHGLHLEPVGKDKDYAREYKIEPHESWKDSAGHIMETVNGVGDFTFYSLKEFLDSGPYTPREAVLTHLSYIERYPEVYGATSARQQFEGSFRNPGAPPKPNPKATKKLKAKLLR